MALWNIKDLESPPITTYKTKKQNVDIVAFKALVKDALLVLTNEELDTEAAYISRWIYRMKNKFRSDKGLQAVEKLNKAMLQLLRVNFVQTLKTFQSMIPNHYSKVTYLPTLNHLHFVLVKIQGVSKLMIRILELCRIAAEFFQDRISIGHFWNVSLICFASIAKIHKIAKEYVRTLCKLYDGLLPFTKVLNNVHFIWLPVGYDFPANLKLFLNADELIEDFTEVTVSNFSDTLIPRIFDLTSEFDLENIDDDDIHEKDTTINQKKVIEDVHMNKVLNSMHAMEIDIGEVVEPKLQTKIVKQEETTHSKLPYEVKSLKDLNLFLNDCRQNKIKHLEKIDKTKLKILQGKLKKLMKKSHKENSDLDAILEQARAVINEL